MAVAKQPMNSINQFYSIFAQEFKRTVADKKVGGSYSNIIYKFYGITDFQV